MLRNSSFIIGHSVRATDGAIGSVTDLLYDDATWTVRWAVVDTGAWLPGRRVLLPPARLVPAQDDAKVFTLPLTCEQVKASPPEETDLPVSRQYEHQLFSHYQWDPYWIGGGAFGVGTMPLLPLPLGNLEPLTGDEHLRSAVTTRGYAVRASDGDIGHVADLLVDPERWSIPLIEIATRNWLPGRKVVLAPGLVEAIDWFEQAMSFAKTKAEIEASPTYDPSMTIDREQLRTMYRHYGLPTDWI
ncbi:MAG TPA: PRC-barrel domain-containing protein [Aliidongia sp.]|uniref:PRC-barrel domain-containing protein n=1 Tax=Aliidongia sp. TaxID=1914230 RepID=UPI002DDC905C|nr:PRC-barrel domain-containing protein [Aliidongia sp.]HEV2673095.1 PRC-barrel domain-containing protein [Aliidongia sp.]